MSLVGHWPLNEWSGRANDVSGNGNHGTVNGATQGVYGVGGLTAYLFDGSDDYVGIGDYSVYDGGPLTIACWVRGDGLEQSGNSHSNWVSKNDSNGTSWNLLWLDGSRPRFLAYDDSGTKFDADGNLTESELEGTWHHVVGTFDGQSIKFYQNGSITDTNSNIGSLNTTSAPVRIGNDGRDSRYWEGYIQDVRIYDRALSPQEVQKLYEMGSGDYTRPSLHDGTDSGAVSRYEFESGSVTTDSWGSNTLTDNTSDGTTTDAVYGTDAKSFDGTDDYMDLPYSDFQKSQSFTISLWSYPTNTGVNETLFGTYDGGDELIQLKQTANNIYVFRLGNLSTDKLSVNTGTVVQDSWVHITGTYDSNSTTLRLYKNGVLLGEDNSTVDTFDTLSNPEIGQRGDSNDYYTGYLDDVRLYNRALSSAEVAQLYRQKHGKDMRKELVKK